MKSVIKAGVLLILGGRLLLGYIDPNTGGMLFQVLAVAFGLLSGVLFFFSGRIKMFIARIRRSSREDDAMDDEGDLGDWEDNTTDLP